VAVIIRRGPSKHTAVVKWDLSNDTFQVGQWLKGVIYPLDSDISPDGQHWIYKVCKKGNFWTGVARVPWLKALDFWPERNGFWSGGGLFINNTSYWLSCGTPYDTRSTMLSKWKKSGARKANGMRMSLNFPEDLRTFYPETYRPQLARLGWRLYGGAPAKSMAPGHAVPMIHTKRANQQWVLKRCLVGFPGMIPSGEEYSLSDGATGAVSELPLWDWGDIHEESLVWAQEGKIMRGSLNPDGSVSGQVVFDTCPMKFEGIAAPY
jgi:hypothetical protein